MANWVSNIVKCANTDALLYLHDFNRIVRLPARPVLWYPEALDLIALLAVATQQQADSEDEAGFDQAITALDGIITGGGTNGDGSKYRVIHLNGHSYGVTMLDGDIFELFEIADNL